MRFKGTHMPIVKILLMKLSPELFESGGRGYECAFDGLVLKCWKLYLNEKRFWKLIYMSC